eukprot:Em0016g731a
MQGWEEEIVGSLHRALSSANVPSRLEPTGLDRADASEVCAAANQAEQTKIKKYSYITSHAYHSFTPVAFETTGVCGPRFMSFLTDLGRRIVNTTGDKSSLAYLLQTFSVAIQRGNAASVLHLGGQPLPGQDGSGNGINQGYIQPAINFCLNCWYRRGLVNGQITECRTNTALDIWDHLSGAYRLQLQGQLQRPGDTIRSRWAEQSGEVMVRSSITAITVQRFKFNFRTRQNGNVATFVSELRQLAMRCDFGASLEEMLRDRLVCGIKDEHFQRRLLAEPNLTFKKAQDIAQALESADRSTADLQQQVQVLQTTIPAFGSENKCRKRVGEVAEREYMLSHLPLPECPADVPTPGETVLLMETLQPSPVNMEEIRTWTKEDPVLSKVKGLLINVTIEKMKLSFAYHGLPVLLVTDNGSNFTSQEFETFLKSHGVRHIRTAPYHPASNGLVERAVQTFKTAMKKSGGKGGSMETSLEAIPPVAAADTPPPEAYPENEQPEQGTDGNNGIGDPRVQEADQPLQLRRSTRARKPPRLGDPYVVGYLAGLRYS